MGPLSPQLTVALSRAAVFTLLKNYEMRGMKVLTDPTSAESIENSESLALIAMIAGSKAKVLLEQLGFATALGFRDMFRQSPSLSEDLKQPGHAAHFQERERIAITDAARLAAQEVVLKDRQTYSDVTEMIVELVARKAAEILARQPDPLRSHETSEPSLGTVLGRAVRKLLVWRN